MKPHASKNIDLGEFRKSSRDGQVAEVREILKQPESLDAQDISVIRSFIIDMIGASPARSAPYLPIIKSAINLFYNPDITSLREKLGITDRFGDRGLTFYEAARLNEKRMITALLKAQLQGTNIVPVHLIMNGLN